MSVNKTELSKVEKLYKWYWRNILTLFEQIKLSPPSLKINNVNEMNLTFDIIEEITAKLESKSQYLFTSINDTLKKLKIWEDYREEYSSTEESLINETEIVKTSKCKSNRLSLKKCKTPVYTDDDLTVCFELNEQTSSLSKKDNLKIVFDDLILNKNESYIDNSMISIVNNKEEITRNEICFIKDEAGDKYILDSSNLQENEQFKICFSNVCCLLRKKPVLVDAEKNDSFINGIKDTCKSSPQILEESFHIKDENELHNGNVFEATIKTDSEGTYCSEVFSNVTEKIGSDSDATTFDNYPNENETTIKEYIADLENLLSASSCYSDISETTSESEDSENNVNNNTTKLENKGRVITNNILNLRREIEMSPNHDIKECYVVLERQEFIEEMVRKQEYQDKDKDELEVNRLTNLNNLKRCRTDANISVSNTPNKKKLRRKILSTSSSKSRSSSSSSSSDKEVAENNIAIDEQFLSNTPDDINSCSTELEIRQLEGLNDINSGNEKRSSTSSGNDGLNSSEEDLEKNSTDRPKLMKKKATTKKRAKWRNDPLLTGKLNSSSSSSDNDSSDGSDILKKRIADNLKIYERNRQQQQNGENSNIVDDQEIASTSKGTDNVEKIILKSTSGSSSSSSSGKKDASSTSSSSSSDSDSSKGSNLLEESVLHISSDSDAEKVTKGRRNIRALISDDILTDATKLANKEEQARQLRLMEREKQFENFYSQTQKTPAEVLVLDVDENYKPLISIHPKLTERLKPHQVEGVKFMWNACYESVNRLKDDPGSGCILAHCMGLGKTFQVITLIHTLFSHKNTNTKYVLVVCPLSTVLNWKNEFDIGLKDVNNTAINVFTISDQIKGKTKRLFTVSKWWKETGVLIMGYDAYVSLVKVTKAVNVHNLQKALINPGPDLFICDEGHLLKNNNTNKCKHFSKIATKRRIILTGTPLQNNLTEYYHMVQFVKPNLLGSYKEFTNRFVNPISNGQFHDSNLHDIHLMKKRSHVLHKLLAKTLQRYESSELQIYLPPKKEYVLFIRLNELQTNLYKKYVSLVNENDNIKKDTLFQHYHNLQLVWNHPVLLDLKEKQDWAKKPKEVDTINLDPDIKDDISLPSGWWKDMCPKNLYKEVEYGSKFLVAKAIIDTCEAIGDKLLIFSSSLVELDGLEHFLTKYGTATKPCWVKGIDYYRLDGTVPPDSRIALCNQFNNPNVRVKAFLISHRVGGLGLNLVAANRVILMDVSWNPSYDTQSIFRIYRFGQTKECFIYRLVSKGTLEETIYVRSINKLAISGRVVDERQISRHYKSNDLKFLYELHDDLTIERPVPKVPTDKLLALLLHRQQKEIFKYHEHQSLLENIPNEELDEEEMKLAWEEFHKEQEQRNGTEVVLEPVPPIPTSRSTSILENLMVQNNYIINSLKTRIQTSLNNNTSSIPSISSNREPPEKSNEVIIIED